MDGENNGKPYEQMDDLGGKPTIFGNIHIWSHLLEMAGGDGIGDSHGRRWSTHRKNIGMRTFFKTATIGTWDGFVVVGWWILDDQFING